MTWWPWHRHAYGPWQVVQQWTLVDLTDAAMWTVGMLPPPRATGFWQLQERVCATCQWRDRRMQETRPGS